MEHDRVERLNSIEGQPPDLVADIAGCPFAPRCRERLEKCDASVPSLLANAANHEVACWHPGDVYG